MIRKEAVEAASKTFFRYEYDRFTEAERESARKMTLAALEAAAAASGMITDDAIAAAVNAAYLPASEHLGLPFMASARDYPNLDDLRAADAQAEEDNKAALAIVIRAALKAAASHMKHSQ